LIASTALSNGTLAIANQPDVGRQGQVVLSNGTVPITAGNIAVTYIANDTTNQVDNILAMNCPVSGSYSVATSKGIVQLGSVVVTGMAGGASPSIQLNDTNSLAVTVDPGFVDFGCSLAYTSGAVPAAGATGVAAVAASAACVTPSTTPNGTVTYSFVASFKAPTV
jgi:hypothetical protein